LFIASCLFVDPSLGFGGLPPLFGLLLFCLRGSDTLFFAAAKLLLALGGLSGLARPLLFSTRPLLCLFLELLWAAPLAFLVA
jgi:hypothetical protein